MGLPQDPPEPVQETETFEEAVQFKPVIPPKDTDEPSEKQNPLVNALPHPSATQIIAGRAGPDKRHGTDTHTLVLDTTPGECKRLDIDGQTSTYFQGKCNLAVLGTDWLTIKMTGTQLLKAPGQDPVQSELEEKFQMSWFRDLSKRDQQVWAAGVFDAPPKTGLDAYEECLVVRGQRMYCPQ